MSVVASYASQLSGARSSVRRRSRPFKTRLAPVLPGALAVALVLFSGSGTSVRADTNAPPPAPSLTEQTNFLQLLQACLQIQEQIHSTQLAIERNRQELNAVASQNAEAVSSGLQTLQDAFSAQRTQDLEAMQKSNRLMLTVAGSLAAAGFVTLLVITYFQWRMSKGLAEISAALPAALGLAPPSALATLGSADESRLRLLGAMEQLDKRIEELKGAISPNGNGDPAAEPDRGSTAAASEPARAGDPARIPSLLSQAQAMMKANNPEGALACFDEVLSLAPNHTEALVKKGATLERLHKLNEAIECYDRAIAADGSMTLAYLHKGGLFNRLERFKEALECYGKALLTHDQRSR